MTATERIAPLSNLKSITYEITSGDLRQGLAAIARGTICEITGAPSTGRTAVANSLLASATRGGEVVAVVDAGDAFDPASAQNAGVDLGKLLWVQCRHRVDHALRATDLILHSGGFGLVLLDLCEASPAALNRIPISYWHRFRLAVEHTPAVLLVVGGQSVARSCAARQYELRQQVLQWQGVEPFQTIQCLATDAVSRKPVGRSAVRLEAVAQGAVAEV
jgi:hypothetical protein